MFIDITEYILELFMIAILVFRINLIWGERNNHMRERRKN
jgi:hypothetical protein